MANFIIPCLFFFIRKSNFVLIGREFLINLEHFFPAFFQPDRISHPLHTFASFSIIG